MNPNVLWGTVSFVIWSTFSTWYYVNYIKDKGADEIPVSLSAPQEVSKPTSVETEKETPKPTAADSALAPVPGPLTRTEEVYFEINRTTPVDGSPLEALVSDLMSSHATVSLTVTIAGHTCDLGSTTYNDNLSLARAGDIADRIRSTGLQIGNLEVINYGESRPAVANDSEENRSRNRRVTVTISYQP